jgi:predicted ArsR family transcriptional regulator
MANTRILEAPKGTRQAILLHLKSHREMSIAQLCDALKITAMAVHRHLSALKAEGLVSSRSQKQQRGRPVMYYSLTENARAVFPTNFENVAVEVLDVIRERDGHAGVMDVLKLRNQKLLEKFRPRMQNKDLKARVEEVSRIFDEIGYMTEWEALPDGGYFIYQRHCAVHNLANQYRQLCVMEPKLIEDLLEVKVARTQYMLKNDPVCGYLVAAQPNR